MSNIYSIILEGGLTNSLDRVDHKNTKVIEEMMQVSLIHNSHGLHLITVYNLKQQEKTRWFVNYKVVDLYNLVKKYVKNYSISYLQ